MGVGRAGQVLPGLTWVIVLSMRSRALRERSPASAGALLLLQGDVDGGRASQWGSGCRGPEAVACYVGCY